MKLLPLVYYHGVAVNEVHDWFGIHHRFSKQSFGAGQVYCTMCGPNLGLQACGEGLDINGSCIVVDENHWSQEDSPSGIVNIPFLIVLLLEDAGIDR